MKSTRIWAPCGLLILCGLIDWSHSYPMIGSEGVESMARNLKDGNKHSGANSVFSDARSGQKAAPPPKIDTFNKGRVQDQYAEMSRTPSAKNSRDYESMAGNDARASQTVKDNQPAQLAQGDKHTFVGKVKTFFTTWPVKFWERIKHWFSKLNFFKSDNQTKPSESNIFKSHDQKGTNPSKYNIFKSDDKKGSNPTKDPPAMPVVNPGPKPTPGTGKGGMAVPIPSADEQPPKANPTRDNFFKSNDQKGTNPFNDKDRLANAMAGVKPKPKPRPAAGGMRVPSPPVVKPKSQPGPGTGATARQIVPSSRASTGYSNNLPLTLRQQHDSRLNMARPSHQIVSGHTPFGVDSAAARNMLGPMFQEHQRMSADLERVANQGNLFAGLDDTKAQEFSSNDHKASVRIIPHGNDGSGTAQAELRSQQFHAKIDPKTKAKTFQMSTSTKQMSADFGPGTFAGLRLSGGKNNIPCHAIDNRDNFLLKAKAAEPSMLTWG